MFKAIETLTIAFVIFFAGALLGNDPPREQKLQQGIDLLESKGDTARALPLFEEAARSSDRALAVRALLYKGLILERQGKQEARATYDKIVREFSNQTDAVNEASRRLAAMGRAASTQTLTQKLVATGADADSGAFISPNGRFMARPDWDTGDAVVRDLSTGKVSKLMAKSGSWDTSDGFVERAIVSPDGRHVVYLWWSDDNEIQNNFEIWMIANESGATPKLLLDSPEYTYFNLIGWSRDAKSVLLTASKTDRTLQFAWLSLADRKLKPLHSLGWRMGRDWPALSPDGKYVAYSALAIDPGRFLNAQQYAALQSKDQHIYILPTDGSGPESVIVRGNSINESPVWTRDGSRLLFVSNRSNSFNLWSAPVQNGKLAGAISLVRNITGRIVPLRVTASDSLYYIPEQLVGAGIDVFAASLNASGRFDHPVPLIENFNDWNRAPSWSPDGKSIAFKRRRSGDDPANRFDLVVQSLVTGLEKTYSMTYISDTPPLWFHDGKSVLTRRNYNDGLWRVDLETGEFRSVESTAHALLPVRWVDAVISKDDRSLFLAVRDPKTRNGSIVSFDLAGGNEKQIWTSGTPLAPAVPMVLSLSHDGRTLAMIVRREEWDKSHLIRIGVDGSGYRDLVSSIVPGMLTWMVDNRGILASIEGENQLMRINAETGKADPTGLMLRDPSHSLDLSPDGTRIVFSDGTRGDSELWVLENVSALWKSSEVTPIN